MRFRTLGLSLLATLIVLSGIGFVFADGHLEIVYAVNREPDTLDLHKGSSRYAMVPGANVFDTYLYLTDDGEYLPWLAEEVTMSDDARVYTIRLRPGVTFHDGTPLNAAAVQYNFDRIVDPATQSRAAVGDLASYERTEIVDDLTARVYFTDPHPAFWFGLSDWRAGGPHSPTALEADPDGFARAPVGTGPFRFVEWVERSHITLERNPDYNWPYPRAEHSGPAHLERITFRTIPENQSRVIAVTTGEVDAAMSIPPQSVIELANNSDIRIESRVLPGTGVILVVNGSKSPTDDPAMRQALQWAIDPTIVSRVGYFNAWAPHLGSVMSAPNPSFLDLSDMYGFDVEEAGRILADAGWADSNGNGTLDKDGNEAVLQYIGFPSAQTTRVIELLQATLRPIGVDVNILELDTGAIQKARQSGDHNIAHLTWIFKDGGFLRTLFHSENLGTGWNFTHYPMAEVDQLLEAAETEADLARRGQLIEQVQRIMLEEAIVIPTVYQQQINAFRSNVQGIKLYEVYGEAPYFYDATIE